ncbi:RING finger and WD repeat domain-containing protein 3 [Linnemannia zychae]|nr:RING finger and WD repeat domain-containing protein 3 [Linnemannia zychae]
MDDDTFDDINEHSFVADSNDSDNDSNHAHQDPDDMLENNHMIPQAPDGHQSLSQDHDFQSQNQVVLRSRVGPERSLVPDPQPQNVETEESTCSICFEPWTNSGMHRLVSIKCGHLFGESCITKWINQNSGSGPAKCPECNLTTTRRDIRKIWSKHVVVVDAIERNEANARATEEKGQRIRCEQELRLSRLAYERLQSDFADLKKRFERERALKIRYRAEAKQLKMRHPEREIIRHFSYVTTQTAPIPIII